MKPMKSFLRTPAVNPLQATSPFGVLFAAPLAFASHMSTNGMAVQP
jgi:hypothetical protein